MARILRGEIRWADLGPTQGREQAGRRPVLVLSHDVFNERSGTVIAMAVTSRPQRAGFPLILEIAAKGLPKRSLIKIGQVRTLAVERMGELAAVLSPEELARAVEGLNEIVGD
jgi:mRNA interferase MazF